MRKSLFLIPIFLMLAWLPACTDSESASTTQQASVTAEEPTAVYQAAQKVWTSFSTEEQQRLGYEFETEDRRSWHFIPHPYKRIGIPLEEMNESQRSATRELLATVLSETGQEQVEAIMALESVLQEIENREADDPTRNPEAYFLVFFGDIALDEPWGWRYEGHHVSLNFTVLGEEISVTPAFLGVNPAQVREGAQAGLEVMAKEQAQARSLILSLDDAQRRAAWPADTAPDDIVTFVSESVSLDDLPFAGLSATDMTDEQRAMLEQLLRLYIGKMDEDIAADEIEKMLNAGGLDALYFFWLGGLEPGDRHYYCLYGPTLIIEYDNTQNNANHIHTVWRDPNNDFGTNLLRHHYETAGPEHGHSH